MTRSRRRVLASRRLGMVLDRATPDRIDFHRKVAVRSPVLVGVALVALAFVPLIAPGAIDELRVLASLLLGGAGVALVRATRSRIERFHLDLRGHRLVGPALDCSTDGARAIALAGSGLAQLHPAALYRAELCLADGRREPLLENQDPARLLRDLSVVLEHLELPVEAGWGLPENATPWRPAPARAAPPPDPPRRHIDVHAPTSPYQRIAGITTLGGGVFTLVAMGLMMTARVERGESLSLLSVVLPALTVVLVLLVGALVLTRRTTVAGNGSLCVQRRALGFRVGQLEIPFERIRHAWAVGPDATVRHVLLQLDDGPVAFACASDEAARCAGQIAAVD